MANESKELQEIVSLLPQTFAQDMLSEAAKEIALCKKVSFDPHGDAAKIDFIMSIAVDKLTMLSKIDVMKELEADWETKGAAAVLERDNGDTESIQLAPEPISMLDIVNAEARLANTIDKYAKMIMKGLHDRRLLSGQMFGDRGSQTKNMSSVRITHRVELSGDGLIGELSGKMGGDEEDIGKILDPVMTFTQTRETQEVRIQAGERKKAPVQVIEIKDPWDDCA